MHDKLASICRSPVMELLDQLHQTYAAVREGQPASYIPELSKANPDWFGICLVTTDGYVYEIGDSAIPFTIQSISKPFVYGLALEDNSRAEVLKKVGVEPTGDAFNSISLDPVTGRPRNPMINAGAIATTGLVGGKSVETRWKRLLEMFSLYAGRELSLDEAIYASENATGHRNRAIGHMLRNFDILTTDPTPIVDLYFKQCSVSVTARDLGVMAATLANGGLNPVTGKRALRGEYVESVLSIMGTCGMYDFAGEWIYKVGLPAKSGVAGGIVAVLPGQVGIGVFSPPLDEHGNSVRGIRVCDDLSRLFNLHLFNTPTAVQFVIRLRYDGSQLSSKRMRNAAETRLLREQGRRIRVYELQGTLTFARTERVVREVIEAVAEIDSLILDLKRVVSLNESASRLFYEVVVKFAELGKTVFFTHSARLSGLRRCMKAKLKERFDALYRTGEDNDRALEWCEDQLLAGFLPAVAENAEVPPWNCELFAGLLPPEMETIGGHLQPHEFTAGEVLIHAGAEAREFYLLTRGRVSVMLPTASGAQKRLATFSPGMTFGEMAVIDGAPRSADVVAATDGACALLSVESFHRLGEACPRLQIVMLQNLAKILTARLRKADREMSVFD